MVYVFILDLEVFREPIKITIPAFVSFVSTESFECGDCRFIPDGFLIRFAGAESAGCVNGG